MATEEPVTRPPELGIADIGDVERIAYCAAGLDKSDAPATVRHVSRGDTNVG